MYLPSLSAITFSILQSSFGFFKIITPLLFVEPWLKNAFPPQSTDRAWLWSMWSTTAVANKPSRSLEGHNTPSLPYLSITSVSSVVRDRLESLEIDLERKVLSSVYRWVFHVLHDSFCKTACYYLKKKFKSIRSLFVYIDLELEWERKGLTSSHCKYRSMAATIFETAIRMTSPQLIFSFNIEFSRRGKQQVKTHGTSLLKIC